MANLSTHFKDGVRTLSAVTSIEVASPLVTRVLGQNPGSFTLQGTNTYLVGTGSSRFLIDAGSGEDHAAAYLKHLVEAMKRVSCESLKGIIITHWHHDHIGGVPSILEHFSKNPSAANAFADIPVYKFIPTEEEALIGSSENSAAARNPYDFYPKEKIIPVSDGQRLTCEGATLRVLHTPGHANDHLCLWLEEEETLFSGDNVLGTGTGVFKDLTTYISSLKRMEQLKPRVIYPGHGPIIKEPVAESQGVSKITEYLTHRLKRVNQVKQVLSQVQASDGTNQRGLSSAAITKQIYTDIPAELLIPAQWNTEKVLTYLKNIGECVTIETAEENLWLLATKKTQNL